MSKELIFPEKGDPSFGSKLMGLKEFQIFKTQPLMPIKNINDFEKHVERSCGGFEKTIYQHLMQHFINKRSSHISRSLLLYHFLGVGKSCSAITISEALLLDHTENEEQRVYVVAPSALHKNFEEELFSTIRFLNNEDIKSQCSGDVYNKLIHGITKDAEGKNTFLNKLHKLIKSRYSFLTYADLNNLENTGHVSNKTFIIDEAHNLRQNETSKASAESLKHILTNGKNNKLVLLSATPMYNEPDEIFWLLSLMLRNEGRIALAEKVEKMHLFNDKVPDTNAFKMLAELSTEYISYIKGNNPFTFPARLNNKNLPYIQEQWTTNMRDRIIATPAGVKQRFTNIKDTDQLNKDEIKGVEELENSSINDSDLKEEGINEGNEHNKLTHKLASATQLQLSNITYTYKPDEKVSAGSKGFYEVFTKVDDESPIQVKYRKGKENALMPVSDKLGEIAPKIKLIMDLIKSSEGIVVIYSQYVWSGIIPCAIALEHMGFNRHGTRKMLAIDSKNIKQTFYKDFNKPSYAILTGAESIMGSTKIEDILPILNNSKNIHGNNIKVILMTPIAGEGLSFKNAREIHILEPWYHFNRTEQVIGRTIRTCSHKILPPEERNVTVYLHACVNTSVEEQVPKKRGKKAKGTHNEMVKTISPDIHAYKISARKQYETLKAEEVIRDNAIDCALLENLNYYPKNIFEMSISMRTSQGEVISYTYGDDEKLQPKCVNPLPIHNGIIESNTSTMNSEIFSDILPTTTLIIEKYIRKIIKNNKDTMYYFPILELRGVLERFVKDDIIIYDTLLKCIYPNKLIEGWKLLPHLNGIIAIPENKIRPIKMARLISNLNDKQNTIYEQSEDSNEKQKQTQINSSDKIKNEVDIIVNNIINNTPDKDPKDCIGIYNSYTMIDSLNWRSIARYLISLENPSKIYTRVCELYAKTGVFIRETEIPRLSAKNKGRMYIGFIDIFDTTQLDIVLIDPVTNIFRDATDAEKNLIISKRKHDPKPKTVNSIYGMLEPTHNKKAPPQLFTNQFKLIGTGAKGPVTRGAICDSKQRTEIEKYLVTNPLNVVPDTKINKDRVCVMLAIELMKHDLMFLYPEYKPR